MYWKFFKKVCCSNTAVKIILIPISLISAELLSLVVSQASLGNVPGVVRYSAGLLTLVLLSAAFQTTVNIALKKEELRAVHGFRLCFLDQFLANSSDRLFRTDYGELIENLTADTEQTSRRYTELYPGIVSNLLGLTGYFLFLVMESPIVAVSLLVISMIQLLPPLLVKKYMQVSYEQCEEMEAAITNHIAEAVTGFETIKLYGLKSWWLQKMANYYRDYLRVGRKADAAAAAQRAMYRLMNTLLQYGTYALIGFYVILGYCSMDAAVQAIYLSQGFFSSVQGLFSAIPDLAVSANAQSRIGKWICSEKNPSDSVIALDGTDHIQMKDLSYRCGEREILRSVNCSFDPNTNYIIKGSNGAGKTTLLNLLAGLLLPENGVLYAGGNGRLLFYIPQQDPQYHCNITSLFEMFGQRHQKKLTMIADRFGLTDRIREGKAVCDLSGGERKKVFLSIGFAMDSQWLLLDEPSNNLDSNAKQVLSELIRERKGIILVSHDLLLTNTADCSMILENGGLQYE